jgi:molybdate transport system substrate-binding protein
MELKLLSAGAAQGVIMALAREFHADTGCSVNGTFGAVGAMREKLMAGAPADLIVLTQAQIAELAADGIVLADACAAIGRVRTGIAVPAGVAMPRIAGADELRATLRAASALYFPDPQRATAGIHFAKILDTLGIAAEIERRLRTYPNGATAMREMADAKDPQAVGCTQITEILNTPGVALVGPLPGEFELATVYSAGVIANAASPGMARSFLKLLTGEGTRALRVGKGFEL